VERQRWAFFLAGRGAAPNFFLFLRRSIGRKGDNRVYRGGNWSWNAQNCRPANRNNNAPLNRNNGLGFRLVSSL